MKGKQESNPGHMGTQAWRRLCRGLKPWPRPRSQPRSLVGMARAPGGTQGKTMPWGATCLRAGFFAFDKSLQCCLVALAFRLQFANQLLACILLGFEAGFGVQVFFTSS